MEKLINIALLVSTLSFSIGLMQGISAGPIAIGLFFGGLFGIAVSVGAIVIRNK